MCIIAIMYSSVIGAATLFVSVSDLIKMFHTTRKMLLQESQSKGSLLVVLGMENHVDDNV